jgi:hypothetical protein
VTSRGHNTWTDEVRRMLRCYRWTCRYIAVVATVVLILQMAGK